VQEFDRNERSSTFCSLDRQITDQDIIKAVKSLGSNKACSLYNVLYKYFKCSIPVIVKPIGVFFNHILDKQSFPKAWATGAIIPIYKKGDKTDHNNYRGITLFIFFGFLYLPNDVTNDDIITRVVYKPTNERKYYG